METGETHQHCTGWLRIWNLEPRAPGLGAWVGGPTAGAQGPKERTPRGADDPAEQTPPQSAHAGQEPGKRRPRAGPCTLKPNAAIHPILYCDCSQKLRNRYEPGSPNTRGPTLRLREEPRSVCGAVSLLQQTFLCL